ncbi:anthranilate phosphoribosyltransferase [Tepidibacillus sp. LV47]|uniref:anthranilate phosphoribosyltransferase n=1 Tax=Tepidibacillus sp. LV47 TaxID=3398228 RepID=UPI003AB0AED9
MSRVLKKLLDGNHLTKEESKQFMEEIITGKVPPHQVTAFMVGLKILGETTEEIVGLVEAMREHAYVPFQVEGPLLDTCGTGGDGTGTINVSTAAALIAATGGIKVAKHGNRAVSGKSGSADVLEALGIPIQQSAEELEKVLQEENIAFLFAPIFHQGMKHAATSRKELGVRTVFNILGPLSNPLKADHQVMGVYRSDLTEPLAEVLHSLGVKRALVVAGLDGMDEITTTTKTRITELKDGEIHTYEITPEQFGIKRATMEDLKGGTPEENAKELLMIFEGKKGPKRDFVLINAGASFYVTGQAVSLEQGIEKARELIDSGQVLQKIGRLRRFKKKEGFAS